MTDLDIETLLKPAIIKEEVYPLRDFLELCRKDPTLYANAAGRIINAIRTLGEPVIIKTDTDPRLLRLYGAGSIRTYPNAFPGIFGQVETLEAIVDFLSFAALGYEQVRQMLCLVGPHGNSKSTIVALIRALYESQPMYVLCTNEGKEPSPVLEAPFGIFMNVAQRRALSDFCGIPEHRFRVPPSAWAMQKMSELGTMTKFSVKRMKPSVARRIGVARLEFGPGIQINPSLYIGTEGVSAKPEDYQYSGALNLATQGFLELSEFLKAPLDNFVLPRAAVADGLYVTRMGEQPFEGVVIGHSNMEEYERHLDDEADSKTLLTCMHVIKMPQITELHAEIDALEAKLKASGDRNAPYTRDALEILARGPVSTRFSKSLSEMLRYDGQIAFPAKGEGARSVRELKVQNSTEKTCEGEDVIGFTGVPTRDTLKLIPPAMHMDPDPNKVGLDPVSALRFMFKPETLSSKELHEKIDEEDLKKSAVQRCRELVTAAIERAYQSDFVKFGVDQFIRYAQLLDAWDRKSDFKEPGSGALKPLVWVDEELRKRESGLQNDEARADFRQQIGMAIEREMTEKEVTEKQILDKLEKVWLELKSEKRQVFLGSMQTPKAEQDEIKKRNRIISFAHLDDEKSRRKHADFVKRMELQGYAAWQTRIMVEWFLGGMRIEDLQKH